MHVSKNIDSIGKSDRVWSCPARQPACILPCSVVVQSRLIVPFFARVSVALRCFSLAAHRLIRRAPIRVILFVRDNVRLMVQLQASRAKVVAELVADELLRRSWLVPVNTSFH